MFISLELDRKHPTALFRHAAKKMIFGEGKTWNACKYIFDEAQRKPHSHVVSNRMILLSE